MGEVGVSGSKWELAGDTVHYGNYEIHALS